MKTMIFSVMVILAAYAGVAAESLTKNDQGIFVGELQKGEMPMKRGQTLVINAAACLGGEITIRVGADRCRYSYQKFLKASAKAEAAEYAQAITVEIESLKDVLTLSLRAPARAPWEGTANSGRMQLHITLPDSCCVRINTAYFDVDAIGPFAEIAIPGSLCETNVEKVYGNVDVNISNRPLAIKDVKGQLTVVNKYGRIRLENIDVHGHVGMVYNEHGEISIDKYSGGLDARTSYDRLMVRELSLSGMDNRIKNVSSLIALAFDSLTAGKLRVNNRYGSVQIAIAGPTDARFVCKSGEGSTVTAERIDIQPVLVDDNHLEFLTGGGAAEVRITAQGEGDILIEGPGMNKTAGGEQ